MPKLKDGCVKPVKGPIFPESAASGAAAAEPQKETLKMLARGGDRAGGGNDMVTGLLASFLDADKDGDVMDDLLDMGKKFF